MRGERFLGFVVGALATVMLPREEPPAEQAAPEEPPIKTALNSMRGTDHFQKNELDVIDRAIKQNLDESAAFSEVLDYFSQHPERAALISSSMHYLAEMPENIAARLAALASIYMRGHP